MIIDVLDAVPGAGKTEYFINHAYSLSLETDPKNILIYAAPTRMLLREVRERLLKKLPKEKHSTVVIDELGSNKVERLSILLGVKKPKSKKDQQAPYGSIILTTHECWTRVPLENESSLAFPRMRQVHLFFDEARQCLHDTVLNLKVPVGIFGTLITLFGGTLIDNHQRSRYDRMVALRKIINDNKLPTKFREERSLEYSNLSGEGNFAFRLFHKIKLSVPSEELREFLKELVRASLTYEERQKENTNDFITKLVEGIIDFNATLSVILDSGRTSVYLWTEPEHCIMQSQTVKPSYQVSQSTNSLVTANCYILTKPTALFTGVSKVTILSAFFRDSQMYHSLIRHEWEHEEKPIADPFLFLLDRDVEKKRWSKDKTLWVKSVADRSSAIIKSTLRDLSVAVLTDDDSTSLTKSLLSGGLLLKSSDWHGSNNNGIKYKLAQKNPRLKTVGDRSLATAVFKDSNPSLLKSVGITDAIKSNVAPPLLSLLQLSLQVANRWSYQQGYDDQFFVILNKESSHLEHYPSSTLTGKCCRDLLENGSHSKVFRALTDRRAVLSIEESEKNVLKFKSAITKITELGPKFCTIASTKTNGVNEYRDMQGICHLAALNLTPDVIRFLESVMESSAKLKIHNFKSKTNQTIVIPSYVVAQDTVLENIAQSMYRVSIRSPQPTPTPVLLICSHEKTAALLENKLQSIYQNLVGDKPVTLKRYKDFPTLSVAKYQYVENEKDRFDRTANARASIAGTYLRLSEDEKKAINSINSRLSLYRKNPEGNSIKIEKLLETRRSLRLIASQRNGKSLKRDYAEGLARTAKARLASSKSRKIPYSEDERKRVSYIADRICQLKKDPDRNEEQIKELEEERFIIKKIALTRK